VSTRRQCVRCHKWFEIEGPHDYVCSATCEWPTPVALTGVCPICGNTFTAARRDKRTCGKARCTKALQRQAARSDRWAVAAKVVPLYHQGGRTLRLCECGCRRPLTGAPQQRFVDDVCRKRSSRRRPSSVGSVSHLAGGATRDTRGARQSGHAQLRVNDSGGSNKINRPKSDTLDPGAPRLVGGAP
jgi:hypothetical protein